LPVLAPNLGALSSRLSQLHTPLVKIYDPEISSLNLAKLIGDGFDAIE